MDHSYNEEHVLHKLKHYLPSQNPLKDFIHHNTLHAFQEFNFFEGIQKATELFGFKTALKIDEFQELYFDGKISEAALNASLKAYLKDEAYKKRLTTGVWKPDVKTQVGNFRNQWHTAYRLDPDKLVLPTLFRVLSSFLDQGISIWNFPTHHLSFLDAIKELDKNTFFSLFKAKKTRELLFSATLNDLLMVLVGREAAFETYLFDQQFSHPGWSGLVSAVEDAPETLLDTKKISLKELIMFELLLEIDLLYHKYGNDWKPLAEIVPFEVLDFKQLCCKSEYFEAIVIFQKALERTYYDQVLTGIQSNLKKEPIKVDKKAFQAIFCIDDRECSLRRYLEKIEPTCQTFGTAGFFGAEFYYQPENGKFLTKVCPAPITPKHLVKETGSTFKHKKEFHFSKNSHNFLSGWFIAQSIGFWSAAKLFFNIFWPKGGPASASSFKHMDAYSNLTIENTNVEHRDHDLQVGFSMEEMANRVENTLRSIGLIDQFANLVYVVGHGASSVNNPHYSAYDCGACSGRAGSVNARVFCAMANHSGVRKLLAVRGIVIPENTEFVGSLHDTTRDEIEFFDDEALFNQELHNSNKECFEIALKFNAKERSRRFELTETHLDANMVHNLVKDRSVSLFEPRPELNHATNALCIVGRRSLTKGLFMDRRAFMNSYDYAQDPTGKYLVGIMNAIAPVCGGINLEYYFSRVDNQKLGAGTKLPHNVIGLIGVANGTDGDLRPGLPSQMIEVHDPLRLLAIVEHRPSVVLDVIKNNPATYEWFENEWVNLIVLDPDTQSFFQFEKGNFKKYEPSLSQLPKVESMYEYAVSSIDNLNVVSFE